MRWFNTLLHGISRHLAKCGFASIATPLALMLSSCSLYNHPFPHPQPQAFPTPNPAGFDLKVVQSDDYGTFWDAPQANNVLEQIDKSTRETNTFVVVFIHGWQHSADPEDDNLRSFNDLLTLLQSQLTGPERTELRKAFTGDANFKLFGVYVGWRGRALPASLNYSTFWSRKGVAERVGDGDVSEFLMRLQRMHLNANSVDRPPIDSSIKPFMGLVSMGHSFGGQVLMRSVARPLELELAMRAPCLSDVAAQPSIRPYQTSDTPVNSMGDLNILLNPAVEAYQFARIDSLYKQLKFTPAQTPQLVVFSADNDSARTTWFPLGRLASLPVRPSARNAYQYDLWNEALGDFEPQQTHEMSISSLPDSLTPNDYSESRPSSSPIGAVPGRPNQGRKVLDYDFSATTSFNGLTMKPKPPIPAKASPAVSSSDEAASSAPLPPTVVNSPVSVVLTHDAIIDGHSGIFGVPFQTFLARYISFIEGKRLLIRHSHFDSEIRSRGGPSQSSQPQAVAMRVIPQKALVPLTSVQCDYKPRP